MADNSALAIAHALSYREAVYFDSREWGRLYRGTKSGLWDAGVIKSDQALPPRAGQRLVAWSPDRRKIEIRKIRKGLFEVKWPYLQGEKAWLPANQKHLERMSRQADGIAGLIRRAAIEIESKSKLRDWTTADSSKLERALEELEYATVDIADLMKNIRDTMANGKSEPDDNDDDDEDPVLPCGPPPSMVTT